MQWGVFMAFQPKRVSTDKDLVGEVGEEPSRKIVKQIFVFRNSFYLHYAVKEIWLLFKWSSCLVTVNFQVGGMGTPFKSCLTSFQRQRKHSPHYWTPVNEVAIVGECISSAMHSLGPLYTRSPRRPRLNPNPTILLTPLGFTLKAKAKLKYNILM